MMFVDFEGSPEIPHRAKKMTFIRKSATLKFDDDDDDSE